MIVGIVMEPRQSYDSFLNYLIDDGAFPLNLPDIATAQQVAHLS
jgi:hypothetical protein